MQFFSYSLENRFARFFPFAFSVSDFQLKKRKRSPGGENWEAIGSAVAALFPPLHSFICPFMRDKEGCGEVRKVNRIDSSGERTCISACIL